MERVQISKTADTERRLQYGNEIVPVEVKSAVNVQSISLRKYKERYGDKVKLRVRFSMRNLTLDGDTLNIPLFLADHSGRLIGIALKQL